MLEILQEENPILRKKSERIGEVTDEIRELADQMIQAARGTDTESMRGAGLAAPQVGKLIRLVVVLKAYKKEEEDWLVMINPEVRKESKSASTYWEGCLSIRHGKLLGPVQRSKRVTIDHLDLEGKPQTLKADGFFAHVVLHEIDHLDGRLFIELVANPKNLWKSEDLDEYLKDHDSFPEAVAD